jgi:hypothetical protein
VPHKTTEETTPTEGSPAGISAIDALKLSIKALPSLKYALVILAVGAILAITSLWRVSYLALVIGVPLAVAAMILMVIFASVARSPQKAFHPVGTVLVWATVLGVLVLFSTLYGCVFWRYPQDLTHWIDPSLRKRSELQETTERVEFTELPYDQAGFVAQVNAQFGTPGWDQFCESCTKAKTITNWTGTCVGYVTDGGVEGLEMTLDLPKNRKPGGVKEILVRCFLPPKKKLADIGKPAIGTRVKVNAAQVDRMFQDGTLEPVPKVQLRMCDMKGIASAIDGDPASL